MSKLFWNLVKFTPAMLGTAFVVANSSAEPAVAQTTDNSELLEQIKQYSGNNQPSANDPMSQLTSVSQLSDVSPGEWAYEALRSLVERYGCIVGYPDRTFRGNRALTRWEFAAGLNSCLNVIERLLQENVAILREDIEKLQRLAQEFAAELAALGARVDNLESRATFLEDHQFSTTTKLKGEVIIAAVGQGGPGDKLNSASNLIDAVGLDQQDLIDDPDLDFTDDDFQDESVDNQFTLGDRIRLDLRTSFTGKDLLRTRFQAGNLPRLDRAFGTESARLGFDDDTDNDLEIDRLYYQFPVGERLEITLSTLHDFDDFLQTYNPYLVSSGTGALSRFERRNPFVYRGPVGAGAIIDYKFSDVFNATAFYQADSDASGDPSPGSGLFNGNFSTGVQIGVAPTDKFEFGIAYLHKYFKNGGVNITGSTGSSYSSGAATALSEATGRGGFRGSRDPFDGAATTSENVGLSGTWQIADWLNWSGWFGWASASANGEDRRGFDRSGDGTNLWTWNSAFSFLDVGKEGAIFSIMGGALPRAGNVDGTLGRDPNQSYIVEGQYKYPVTDNIILTPGVYAIFNPNNNRDNDTIWVGVLRTTFKF